MADKLRKMSSDDFKNWVLYFHPAHKPSMKAFNNANHCTDVIAKNVAQVKYTPKFLQGIPTLLDKKNSVVFEGTSAIEKLESLRGFSYDTSLGVSNMSFDGGYLNTQYTLNDNEITDLGDGYGERENYKRTSKLTDNELQNYINERNTILPQVRRPVG